MATQRSKQQQDPDDQRPVTFVVPGVRQAAAQQPGPTSRGGGPPAAVDLPGRVKDSVALSLRRSGTAGADSVRVTAVPGEDVVVLRIAGGPALVLHPHNARDLLLGQGSARRSASRGADDEVPVPAQLRWQGLEQAAPTRTRGFLGDVLLSAFEVITGVGQGTAKDTATRFVASQVVARVDGQVDAGVYALQADALAPLKGSAHKLARVPAAPRPEQDALLVLVHGTFVDTVSTFGKLWVQHPQRVAALFTQYGGRVYALDHPTLAVSPIHNALTLVAALPPGARLHLATHSRGGLVAEVLALACGRVALQQPLAPDDLALFAGAAHAPQLQELQALMKAVADKNIRVDRVVRVACPARGTLLASKRLDAYLSVLKWTLELARVPVVPMLVDFLAEVARRRADPGELPGLASMIPDTPLVNWLNQNEEAIPGELRVVAGDLQGDSIGSWIKTLLADAYYWTDNDIVVQTRSMYGGAARQGGASFLLDQGGHSTHFGYFANERTAQAVVDALQQDAPAGFRPIGPLSWAGQDSGGLRGARRAGEDGTPAADRPAVFVLPGILGSHLKVGDKRIWLSLRLIGGLSRLAYQPNGADAVSEDGPIGLVYDDLIEHLAASHAVIPFGFDWRRPIEDEAARLADAVERELDLRSGSGQPVRLIAHSMGGVLARTMQLVRPKTFERLMQRDGARLLMLGTPNGGSWAPMQVLSGDDTFGNALASFGSPLRDRQARQLMAQMPGFIQLQARLLDGTLALDREPTWAELARRDLQAVQDANWWHHSAGEAGEAAYEWGVPPQAVLDAARALRVRLDAQFGDGNAGLAADAAAGASSTATSTSTSTSAATATGLRAYADRMLLVVGQARFTPAGYEWGSDGFAYFDATDGGDGRVTLESALLPGVRTWRVDAAHGSLPDTGSAFEAYVELLVRGDTQRLERLAAAPGVSRTARDSTPAAVLPPVVHVRSRPSRARPSALPAAGERQVLAATAGVPTGAPDRRGAPPLQVTVLNGNLSFVRGTLMLGHSRALQLTGTEYVVNRLVGGAMQDSLHAGLYPDGTGSHQLFVNARADADNPWRAPQPASVVVVGLGEEGKLTERELTRTVRQGVIAWVQRMQEGSLALPGATAAGTAAASLPQTVLELTATLMGSGGTGIYASTSARAVAQGVRDANRRLAALRPDHAPRVGQLTLVELYLERASDAWQGLQVLGDASPDDFLITPTIQAGVGPLRRQIDSGYRGTDYDFITATGQGSDTIAFRLDTKRARTEVNAQSTQGKLLRELVRRASTEANNDAQLGRTLFQLLVPLEVEPFLAGTSRMLLELDDTTAAIPWEMLDTRSAEHMRQADAGGPAAVDEQPWAIRTRLLRKLQTENFRQFVQDARDDDAVLVIGEPQVDADTYVALPGARAEAEAVRDAFLGSGGLAPGRVKALVDDNDATSIINALYAHCYRIVHIAGHGEPIKRRADRSVASYGGVVLSEGTYLGPQEIRAMRTVPELVFVNCCHLAARDADQALRGGRDQPDADKFNRAEFAMGVADALIAIGVRCVIAAGWAVDDEPAKIFADTFYRAILARRPFIDAVAQAREAAWRAAPGSNTWAAYQAYGDPDWVYRKGAHDTMAVATQHSEQFDGIASPLGLTLALEEQAVRVRWMQADRQGQLDNVRLLERRFGTLWGGMGAVAEAFGLAYAEGGAIDAAIGWYERALRANDASASMQAHEQLGNLRTRRGAQWGRGAVRGSAALEQGITEISTALGTLQALARLQPTLQRLSLCGSAWKRLAMLQRRAGNTQQEDEAWQMALQSYSEAEALGRAAASGELFYPLMNRLTLSWMIHGARGGGLGGGSRGAGAGAAGKSRGGWSGFDPRDVDAAQTALRDKTRREPEFWSVAGLIELDLLLAVAEGRLAEEQGSLQARFNELHGRVTSPLAWDSVADQAEMLLGAWPRNARPAEREAAAALAGLLRRFAPFTTAAAR